MQAVDSRSLAAAAASLLGHTTPEIRGHAGQQPRQSRGLQPFTASPTPPLTCKPSIPRATVARDPTQSNRSSPDSSRFYYPRHVARAAPGFPPHQSPPTAATAARPPLPRVAFRSNSPSPPPPPAKSRAPLGRQAAARTLTTRALQGSARE
ncbi:hypothetical protein PAHAL_5G530600 [Panicum hallii]|jgi:hypothetical protein|uniref:Uncharacterized protein n=1 Tax=Panicum hallii TaxID=206008 RepID=A0A2S3HZ91_9POAL|nr:hypothetical protein PAHAL_5G530600 [Panicum hallii]